MNEFSHFLNEFSHVGSEGYRQRASGIKLNTLYTIDIVYYFDHMCTITYRYLYAIR